MAKISILKAKRENPAITEPDPCCDGLKISEMTEKTNLAGEEMIPVQDGFNNFKVKASEIAKLSGGGGNEVEVNDTGVEPTDPNTDLYIDFSKEVDVLEEAPADGRTYARKDGAWDDITIPVEAVGDKAYNPSEFSGIARVNLPKNNGVLTQDMMPVDTGKNTIYVIQYDYTLNDQTITVPENCVLKFEGGSIKDGNINGNNVKLHEGSNYNIFNNCIINGLNVEYIDVRWVGGIPDYDTKTNLGTDNSEAFSRAVYNIQANNYLIPIKVVGNYYIGKTVEIPFFSMVGTFQSQRKLYNAENTLIDNPSSGIYIADGIIGFRIVGVKDFYAGLRNFSVITIKNIFAQTLNKTSTFIKVDAFNTPSRNVLVSEFEAKGFYKVLDFYDEKNDDVNVDALIEKCQCWGGVYSVYAKKSMIHIKDSTLEQGACIHSEKTFGTGLSIENCLLEGQGGEELPTIYITTVNSGTIVKISNNYFEQNKGKFIKIESGENARIEITKNRLISLSPSIYNSEIYIDGKGNSSLKISDNANVDARNNKPLITLRNLILLEYDYNLSNYSFTNIDLRNINSKDIYVMGMEDSVFYLSTDYVTDRVPYIKGAKINPTTQYINTYYGNMEGFSKKLTIYNSKYESIFQPIEKEGTIIGGTAVDINGKIGNKVFIPICGNRDSDIEISADGDTINKFRIKGNCVNLIIFTLKKDTKKIELKGINISPFFTSVSKYIITIQVQLSSNFPLSLVATLPSDIYLTMGSTLERPILKEIGDTYLDTTVGYMTVWDGENWVNADDNRVKSVFKKVGKSLERPPVKESDFGSSYYDLDLGKVLFRSSKYAYWSDANGFSIEAKKEGATSDRPLGSSLGFINGLGYIYKDTTLGKLIVFDGKKWSYLNDIPLNIIREGSSSLRPSDVDDGFYYFDTTINKPIWRRAASPSGWVKADGTDADAQAPTV